MSGEFSRRLVEARKRAGMTQADLAHAMQRDRSLISHLELGHTGKGAAELRNVAQGLGVSADYLLGLSDAPVCTVCEVRRLHAELGAKIDRLTDAIRSLVDRLDHTET